MVFEPKAETVVAGRKGDETKDQDVDDAWAFLESHPSPAHAASDDELKAIRRKVDLGLLPLLFAAYTLQFIDKALLNVCSSMLLFRPIAVIPVVRIENLTIKYLE